MLGELPTDTGDHTEWEPGLPPTVSYTPSLLGLQVCLALVGSSCKLVGWVNTSVKGNASCSRQHGQPSSKGVSARRPSAAAP